MSSYENETPSGTVADDSYVSRSGPKNEEVSVQSDRERVEDPVEESVVESGLRLGRDEREAIDTANIIDDRTRHAKPVTGTYRLPGDDEGLPVDDEGLTADDGTSSADDGASSAGVEASE
ncbi:hypothetical protein F4820DRAFT_365265 [Hypoxylon rubiginosum]|uniref:Uncharacterized protein n=1 Tax=Hypoxylon rubiginosum TaxID=110542 RepID=A0ACB9ZD95_9PEZI|nr:hypothetical protein F4820DRAFT_365265 [Hypoxylon rubiginosum]